MKRVTLNLLPIVAAACLLLPVALQAQEKIGVVDMQRAIAESSEGKKAEVKFTAKVEQFRKDIEGRQKHIEDQQNKLKTQDKMLSDATKVDINKDIEKTQTELKRVQEDDQKELQTMQSDLMRPIGQVAEAALNQFAQDHGFTLIIDSSNPQNNSIVYVDVKNAEITDYIIRLIDAEMAKAAPPNVIDAPPKKPLP